MLFSSRSIAIIFIELYFLNYHVFSLIFNNHNRYSHFRVYFFSHKVVLLLVTIFMYLAMRGSRGGGGGGQGVLTPWKIAKLYGT